MSLTKFSVFEASRSFSSNSSFRQFSQLVKSNGQRLFLVDTLALGRRLEGQGVPSKQAEAITIAIIEVLNDNLENVSKSLVSKVEMQRTEMFQESNLSKFKTEVQSSQEHHSSVLKHETEKLRNDISNMCSEYANEMQNMRSELRHEIDKASHALSAQLEGAKYDIIKYNIGTLYQYLPLALLFSTS